MNRHGARADGSAVRRLELGLSACPATPVEQRRARRALVVDDERALMTVVCRVVETIGWVSDGYADPAEAIASLVSDPAAYDIVLTDLRLGDQTGLDVATAAVRVRPGIPVILLSGAPLSAAMWDAAADVGVQMVLYKPFHIHELLDAVRSLTDAPSEEPRPSAPRLAVLSGALAD
ncbi:MAG: response regulator [Gemmatimonadetes bacterium]|nr:response regulator [Gemmatimonadota bacterium]